MTEYINVNNAERRIKICPKCKERDRYKENSYCLPCTNEYMKERRKDPGLRKKATEYKRLYRERKKNGTSNNR